MHGHWRRRWSAAHEGTHHGFGERHGRHGGRHGRGGGERGGWGRRYFEHGALRILALALIAEKPRNGYEIIKAVEEKTGGGYAPSPGVIYPTLNLLEESGQIRPVEIDGKKVFEITEEGQATLAANRKIIDAFEARFTESAEDAGPHRSEIRRAVRRLIHAVREKFADGDMSAAKITTLVAAIDAAAEAVEKA